MSIASWMRSKAPKPYVNRARRIKTGSHKLSSHYAALSLAVISTAIFVLTAILSYFVAYDQVAARGKLTLMLGGLLLPLALAVLARGKWETALGVVGVICGFAAGIVGVLGLAVKLAEVEALSGGLIGLVLAPVLTWPVTLAFASANLAQGSAAGSLIVLLPLAGCGAIWAVAQRIRLLWWMLGACLLIASLALVTSGENSAWIGLLLGTLLALYMAWRFALRMPSRWVRVVDGLLILLFVLVLGIYLFLLLGPEPAVRPYAELVPFYLQDRIGDYRDSLAAVQDYLFTGGGLANADMVLSSYVYVMHVPYQPYIHNLFMEVALEQGILGLIGLLGMIIAGLWSITFALRRRQGRFRGYAVCIGASLLTLFISGLFESDIYASRMVFLMFLPFGFAWVLGEFQVVIETVRRPFLSRIRPRDVLVGFLPIGLMIVVIVLPGAQARLLANWAAVQQSRSELSDYTWEEWGIQDRFRRENAALLEPALREYAASLVYDPENVTANRRMGQIALSYGDLDSARTYLEAAYAAAPWQRPTRLLLGETYALQGELEAAARLWSAVEHRNDYLQGRLWWYGDHLGNGTAAQSLRDADAMATQ